MGRIFGMRPIFMRLSLKIQKDMQAVTDTASDDTHGEIEMS